MAYPSTEVDRFRSQVNRTVENMRDINALLTINEDHGTAWDANKYAIAKLIKWG